MNPYPCQWSVCALLLCGVLVYVVAQQPALPDARSCERRTTHATYRDPRGVEHEYFFAWEDRRTSNVQFSWSDARNICRRVCMDLVSIESSAENRFIKRRMASGNLPNTGTWTSGRKCNFNGCNSPDLQPPLVNGWFWSAVGDKISTFNRDGSDWSNTGRTGISQPDNDERLRKNGNDEGCLAVLNNFYGDGIRWHDAACDHKKSFVCEDSDELLDYIQERNPDVRV